jgi:23S rRNA (pseudouridine1915-N3)-methyltransferase
MKILLLAIGKRHDPLLAAAIDDYAKRLSKSFDVRWQLLEPAKGKQGQAVTRRIETKALAAELQSEDFVVLLDERGHQWTSVELAEQLEKWRLGAISRVVFIIGGAFGVEDELRQRVSTVWSLSRLVFPHQLIRLLLVEQLYRATAITAGLPYHHK